MRVGVGKPEEQEEDALGTMLICGYVMVVLNRMWMEEEAWERI